MKKQKVFGIDYHKIGTSSLGVALTQLGHNVTGPDKVHNWKVVEYMDVMVFDMAEKHDAFQDNPWPFYYRQMGEKYPGSKFILTVCDTEKWINRLIKHFGRHTTPMREWIYRKGNCSPSNHEQLHIDRYEKHNASAHTTIFSENVLPESCA